jgi:gliding motility-associated lipoprotein GldD
MQNIDKMLKRKSFIRLLMLLSGGFFLFACRDEVYIPKPRAYFRITLHDTTYRPLTEKLPYMFEYSHDAYMDRVNKHEGSLWINFLYPIQNAVIFTNYISLDTADLADLIQDSRFIATRQMIRADDMVQSDIWDTNARLYGKIFETVGNHAACPYQFWITDEENHFFRAAMYLNSTPQNDSLAPIIHHIKKDMLHIIKTFAWTQPR